MAYISQEKKKELAPHVKSVLTKYGLKGTLGIRHHSTLVLTISSGQIDFIKNYNDTAPENKADKCIDVNPYWYTQHFTDDAQYAICELYAALKGAEWYDRSDLMTDYFDVAYYIDLNIGKWNKPYIHTK